MAQFFQGASPSDIPLPGQPTSRVASRAGFPRVVVATTAMLSFISFWRAAAIVLNDLGSSAYYAGGIAEQAIGKPLRGSSSRSCCSPMPRARSTSRVECVVLPRAYQLSLSVIPRHWRDVARAGIPRLAHAGRVADTGSSCPETRWGYHSAPEAQSSWPVRK
jgi:hypothetical protein